MRIEIREMREDEAALAWKTGKPSFGLIERMAFQKPKQAFLAIADAQIVGMASFCSFPGKNDQKIGYVEVGYVKKGCEGEGIGGELYKRATTHLKEQGCETVTATVKDDNVASWKLFENNGYRITGFIQLLHCYGLLSTIRLWLKSTLAIATGFHLWSTIPGRGRSTIQQVGIFALLNLIVLLPVLALGGSLLDFGLRACVTALLLSAALLGGLLGTLFFKEKWCFFTTRGGVLISFLVTSLGGIWPVVGRFYPVIYRRTPGFRRDMGVEGLLEWLALLFMIGVASLKKDQLAFWNYVFSFGKNLLLIHALPVYPFSSFGGKRIWDYSKGLSVITIIISAVLLFLWK